MKFLNVTKLSLILKNKPTDNIAIKLLKEFEKTEKYKSLINYEYFKKVVKNRKVFSKIRQGVTKTEKKNSLKRDTNNTTTQKFLNIISTKTNKGVTFKHLNKAVESFFFILNDDNLEFYKYKNYKPMYFLTENVKKYNDFDYLFNFFLPQYFSVFDIRTKKNRKKGRFVKKYISEISYIPPFRRLKNTLKIISVYSENFKNYELWERLFWMFLTVLLDKKNLYITKRRSYIYKKSIKFFVKRK